jgi:histone H3/H4
MSYVVASAVKDFVNKKGMNAAGDLAESASAFLAAALDKACSRAKANGRKTVRPEDL